MGPPNVKTCKSHLPGSICIHSLGTSCERNSSAVFQLSVPLTECKHTLPFSFPPLKLHTGSVLWEQELLPLDAFLMFVGSSVGHRMNFSRKVSSGLHGTILQGEASELLQPRPCQKGAQILRGVVGGGQGAVPALPLPLLRVYTDSSVLLMQQSFAAFILRRVREEIS